MTIEGLLMTTGLELFLSILAHRVRNYLEAKAFFIPEQLGFREGRECVESSLVLKEVLHRRRNAAKSTYLGFVDTKKAYDSAPPPVLLYKPRRAGMPPTLPRLLLLLLLRSLLSDHLVQVRCPSTYSGWML